VFKALVFGVKVSVVYKHSGAKGVWCERLCGKKLQVQESSDVKVVGI